LTRRIAGLGTKRMRLPLQFEPLDRSLEIGEWHHDGFAPNR
jgi:hypothetical protein